MYSMLEMTPVFSASSALNNTPHINTIQTICNENTSVYRVWPSKCSSHLHWRSAYSIQKIYSRNQQTALGVFTIRLGKKLEQCANYTTFRNVGPLPSSSNDTSCNLFWILPAYSKSSKINEQQPKVIYQVMKIANFSVNGWYPYQISARLYIILHLYTKSS